MSNFTVSTRYAKAFLEFSEEKNIFETVSGDVELIFNTFNASRELRLAILNPVISNSKKNDILTALFANKIDGETLNFLQFLIDKNREEVLFDTLKRFLELRDEKLNIANVLVTSPVELSESQKEELKRKLAVYTGKNVKMNYRIDKSILGGFIVKIGDTVLDASVLHQLVLLRKKLLNQSYNLN